MFLVDTPSHTLIKKYYVTICVPLILTNFVEYKLVYLLYRRFVHVGIVQIHG